MTVASLPAAFRLVGKYEVTDTCWLWTGALNREGYGRLGVGRKSSALAHRVAYEAWVGPIPDGLVIDHLCFVTRCINPAHLEAVTIAENTRRFKARQTHCKRGHEFTPENTMTGRGRRRCRECDRADQRMRYQRRRLSRD